MASGQNLAVGQLLLAEYQAIKDEQKARIGFRDNLLYVTLAAVAAIAAATAQSRQPALLLALPPVCLILGWTYLVNDEKISAIGRYIRTDLGPRLAASALVDVANTPETQTESVFGWEGAHRNDPLRRSRKIIQCVIDVVAFCLVPTCCLAVYWASGRTHAPMTVVSVLEALTLLSLAVQIILYSRPHRA
ncbi:hypothetical protein [Streptomyces sp. NPDC001275]